MADAARPSSRAGKVDDGDRVIEILSGLGLEVRPHAIRAAIQSKPEGNPIAAAETVVRWKRNGETTSPEAGVLLTAALKAQRSTTLDRAIAWAKRNLPDEHPPFAALAAMALKSGGWPVTAESVLRKLRKQGCDMASLEALGERFAEQEKRS